MIFVSRFLYIYTNLNIYILILIGSNIDINSEVNRDYESSENDSNPSENEQEIDKIDEIPQG